ncbi:penicillin-binding protein 1B [Aliidiomarina sp. Khilg15.8]
MKTWIRNGLSLALKLGVISVVLLFFYTIYLDGVVTQRFEENRYQAPALLYSRALQLDVSEPVSQTQVEQELAALNYRETRYAREPGEYNQRGDMILLHRRAFDFADGFEPSQRLRLRFADGLLTELLAWPSQQHLSAARLEPQLIGRFSADSGEDRLLVGLDQVPELMQQTLLLVEDRDFYQHHGIQPSSIARAALANLAAGRTVQGGSTLTQQLVKNMYLTRAQTLQRKANEAIMALILDFRFDKTAILEAYFNEVYFGQDRGYAIHGVGLGAHFFYGKSVEDLDPAEIAMMVGIVRGPSLYDPRRRPENAAERRDYVLRLMYEADLISQPQYLAGLDAPLVRKGSSRLVLRDRPAYVDLVQRELRELVPGREWQQTGLRVFTYFDPYAQQEAEQALTRRGGLLQVDGLEGAAVVSDYKRGVVRALVGSMIPGQAGFNRALTAQRPIGSLVKPFIYTLALEEPTRYRLETLVDDASLTLVDEREREWTPQNFDGEFKGPMTLYQSWIESRNIAAVRVGQALGTDKVRERLYHAGFDRQTHAYPSLLLGSVEMSPLQVTQIYSALANRGQQHRLTSIEAVATHWGQPLYQRQDRQQPVFSEEASYLANYALQGVVREGTASALTYQLEQTGLAGKTGSTNDLRDSWFVSYDNKHLLTVWLGRDDNQSIGLSGSTGAVPVARDFWRSHGVENINRTRPRSLVQGAFDAATGEAVARTCDNALLLPTHVYEVSDDIGCDGELQPDESEDERSWFERIFGRN